MECSGVKKISAIAFLLFLPLLALSQTTKVRGTVLDATTGEPVSFAAVYFKGTMIGQTADIDGQYSIETRDPEAKILTVQMMGYETVEVEVPQAQYSQLDFQLKQLRNEIKGSKVKADNSKARRLLANIDAHREANDPESHRGYETDVYTKIELDLTHPDDFRKSKAIQRDWSFIFDYIDTSAISGNAYLPIMISESVSKRFHSKAPDATREDIIANQISGINPENNLISQFAGNMYVRVNFYDDYINFLNVQIPSPTNRSGLMFYNYYIVDSTKVDGRKTYVVRYHPKPMESTPAFDGEMLIDAQEYAIRSLTAKLTRGANVNWVRDVYMEAAYKRGADSTWFYDADRLYAEFSISTADSSKIFSFIGDRHSYYTLCDFDSDATVSRASGPVKVYEEANSMPAEYWEQNRPYELSAKEKGIYEMVDRIKNAPLYNTLYNIGYTIVSGYYDVGPVGFGSYLKLFSANNMEGFRMRLGVHTSKEFSTKDRFDAFVAYGFRDHAVKGGLTYTHMFSKEPTRMLTVDVHRDALQLGKGSGEYNDGNILATIAGGFSRKLCMVNEASIAYEHEVNQGLSLYGDARYRRYFDSEWVPILTPQGESMNTVGEAQAHLRARLSWDETVIRGYFKKKYMYTRKPIVSLDLYGGLGDCGASQYRYLSPRFTFDWRLPIPPIGLSKMRIQGGAIFGQVPYQMLYLFEGNGTNMLEHNGFANVDLFEFAADRWATFYYEHNFYGFFLGRIPFVEKLKLREVLVFRAGYGALSSKNDGSLGPASKSLLLFPEGMKEMGTPYMEAGFAISNIFQILRFDFVWRITHRDRRPFTWTIGVDLRF